MHRNQFWVDSVGLVVVIGSKIVGICTPDYLGPLLLLNRINYLGCTIWPVLRSWMHNLDLVTGYVHPFWTSAMYNVHCASILDGLSGLGYEMRLSWMHSAARVTRCRSVKGAQKCNGVSLCAG